MIAFLEYVHFTCTSEDINNICHALMLKDAKDKIMLPYLDTVYGLLKSYSQEVKNFS